MGITQKQMVAMFSCAADEIVLSKDELTEIDSKFGDADHGITMEKVAKMMKQAAESEAEDSGIKKLLGDIASAVLTINGGSAVPLWNTFLSGLEDAAPEATSMSEADFKKMFRVGLDTLSELSGAKVGDKTMMDSLIPAIEALEKADDDLESMMAAAETAARAGAKASEGFVSKFGRARSYKEQTLGTPDAGAVSMMYFFVGLHKGVTK